MDRDVLRLECLKLAHAHGREIVEVVHRASEYEKFVTDSLNKDAPKAEKSATPPQKGVKTKNVGNPTLFD